MRRGLAVAVGLVLLAAGSALAHTRSTSSAEWEISSGPPASARVRVRASVSDLRAAIETGVASEARAGQALDAAAIDAFLRAHFVLLADGVPCPAVGAASAPAARDLSHVTRVWRVSCPAGTSRLAIRSDGFFDALPAHFHLQRVKVDDRPPEEHLVVFETRNLPRAVSRGGASVTTVTSTFADFLALGARHIAGGADHLAFLLALVLVARSLRAVVVLVSGFTVGHTLTLGIGLLGWLAPAPRAIEALIGLSIAVVALDDLALTVRAETRRAITVVLGASLLLAFAGSIAGRVAIPALTLFGVGLFSIGQFVLGAGTDGRSRGWIAFAFGLIHGLGFAGTLLEASVPADRLLVALAGFNLGVEVAQLLAVVLVWPLLAWGSLQTGGARWNQYGAAPVLCAGVYWFLSRSLGG